MGSGIAAAIPIIIIPHNCRWKYEIDLKYFSPRLLDYYHYDTESHNYTIKHEVLLENYQTFLIEFYALLSQENEFTLTYSI